MVSPVGITISIVIPCLNEGKFIKKTLTNVYSLTGSFEVIVVDGGSTDETIDIVKKFESVNLVPSAKGRSIQMNKGAKVAKGDILLFLHADTFLPENTYDSITTALEKPEIVAGSFYLMFDHENWALNMYTWMSRFNFSLFTYGDHGIFVKKQIFEDIGGYKEIPFMEDVEIQSRFSNVGRFGKLDTAVLTSARRFIKTGPFRQLIFDLWLIFLFKIGVSPVWLKKFYKDQF